MKKLSLPIFLILLLLAGIATAQSVGDALEGLKDPDWQERRKALQEVLKRELKPDQYKVMDNGDVYVWKIWEKETRVDKQVQTALIELLDKESRFEKEYIDSLVGQGMTLNDAMDEFREKYRLRGYEDYYLSLAWAVVKFQDTRAIPALLRSIRYYGPEIGPAHIVAIGEDAVEPLLQAMDSEDEELRGMASYVLSVWGNEVPDEGGDTYIPKEMGIKDKSKREKIKEKFLEVLKSEPSSDVRHTAAYGLEAFPEEKVMKQLQETAETDPNPNVRARAKFTIENLNKKMNLMPQKAAP